MQRRLEELQILVAKEGRIVENRFRQFLWQVFVVGIMSFAYFVLFDYIFYSNHTQELFSTAQFANVENIVVVEQENTEKLPRLANEKPNIVLQFVKKVIQKQIKELYVASIKKDEEASLASIKNDETDTLPSELEDGEKWPPQYVDDLQRLNDSEFQAELNAQKGFPEYADEVDWLSWVIEYEVGNSTRADKIYTACVVINRARTQYYFFKKYNTIYAVLHQSGQYSTLKKIDAAMKAGKKASPESIEVAQGLIDGSIQCLEECVLFQLLHKPGGSLGKNLYDAKLPGAKEYYGIPKDFCAKEDLPGNLDGNTWTSNYYPMSLEEAE